MDAVGAPIALADVRRIEYALSTAWPAVEVGQIDGWQWRCSGGGARRGNSVLAVDYSGRDLSDSIAAVEARYRARGLRSYFHISSISQPPALDETLAARGYQIEDPCLLLVKTAAADTALSGPAEVTHTSDVSADWLAVYSAELDTIRKAAAPGTLARIPSPRAFFTLRRGDAAIGTALCVLPAPDIAVVECVATAAAARRSGAASAIMASVEAWATARGARFIALQVVRSNAAACRLYTGLGYSIAATYHYRWRNP